MKRNRVNVLTVVNSASNITTETIDGKPHIVVRGITPVVDDIVMNRKLYPAAEIEKAYNTLERNPMPLGHPRVDGKHVSARDVRAVNEYHVGAWLQNVTHKDGKVTGDMYVNRQYAESSEKGKRLINRLDEMLAAPIPSLSISQQGCSIPVSRQTVSRREKSTTRSPPTCCLTMWRCCLMSPALAHQKKA